jgi:hypothetical protein
VRWRHYVSIVTGVSVAVALAACASTGPTALLKFKSAAMVTIATGAARNVLISTNDPGAVIKESGALPPGMSLRGGPGGTEVIAGVPQAGSGGRYTLHFLASDGSRRADQTVALTINDKPAFSPFNNPTIVGTFPGSAQTPILVTGYPTPVLTMTAAGGGKPPSAIALHPYADGGALMTVKPGWLESPCSNRITLTATSSAGTAMETITVSLVDVRCLPSAVLDFFVKNAVSIGKGIYKGGKFVGQWIVKGGKAVGKLFYKGGKATEAVALPAAESIPEDEA